MSSTGVVVFNYAAWIARYPEFAAVLEPTAQLYFDEATLYLNNTACSIVADTSKRATLLNMLTAHIAWLNRKDASGQPANPLVGRIDSATEGSVSVHADMTGVPGTAAWFLQSAYGAAYWQATAMYRTMRYIPGPVTPVPFGWGPVARPWGWR